MHNSIFILIIISLLHCDFSSNKFNSKFYSDDRLPSYNSDIKSIIKSIIIPGWGQYSSKKYKKAYLFLFIESISIGTYWYYNNQGEKLHDSTLSYGDKHWSFTRWIENSTQFDECAFIKRRGRKCWFHSLR